MSFCCRRRRREPKRNNGRCIEHRWSLSWKHLLASPTRSSVAALRANIMSEKKTRNAHSSSLVFLGRLESDRGPRGVHSTPVVLVFFPHKSNEDLSRGERNEEERERNNGKPLAQSESLCSSTKASNLGEFSHHCFGFDDWSNV